MADASQQISMFLQNMKTKLRAHFLVLLYQYGANHVSWSEKRGYGQVGVQLSLGARQGWSLSPVAPFWVTDLWFSGKGLTELNSGTFLASLSWGSASTRFLLLTLGCPGYNRQTNKT